MVISVGILVVILVGILVGIFDDIVVKSEGVVAANPDSVRGQQQYNRHHGPFGILKRDIFLMEWKLEANATV